MFEPDQLFDFADKKRLEEVVLGFILSLFLGGIAVFLGAVFIVGLMFV